MTQSEQIEAFVADITKVIDRYRFEFELPLATAIGALEALKLDLWKEHSAPPEQ